jgi:hypothetical protein
MRKSSRGTLRRAHQHHESSKRPRDDQNTHNGHLAALDRSELANTQRFA